MFTDNWHKNISVIPDRRIVRQYLSHGATLILPDLPQEIGLEPLPGHNFDELLHAARISSGLEFHHDKYTDVLAGVHPDWRLWLVRFFPHSLSLHYYSDERTDEYDYDHKYFKPKGHARVEVMSAERLGLKFTLPGTPHREERFYLCQMQCLPDGTRVSSYTIEDTSGNQETVSFSSKGNTGLL